MGTYLPRMKSLLWQTWTSESSRCESVQKSGSATIGCLPPTPTYTVIGLVLECRANIKKRFSTYRFQPLLDIRSANPFTTQFSGSHPRRVSGVEPPSLGKLLPAPGNCKLHQPQHSPRGPASSRSTSPSALAPVSASSTHTHTQTHTHTHTNINAQQTPQQPCRWTSKRCGGAGRPS